LRAEGLRYREIAEVLGISLGAVANSLERSITRLARAYQRWEHTMSGDHVHLSDAELLMAADGELQKTRAAEIENHLAFCWACRERMRSIEETITDFVRARNSEFVNAIPSEDGPRALLRSRLAELRTPPRAAARLAFWRLTTALACCSVLVLGLVFFERTVSANAPRPNSIVTPGETRPIALADVCRNHEAEVVRDIPVEMRQQVLAAYGIKPGKRADFEVDYLITPDLGGVDSVRNLWPQPYSVRWNAKVKDRLEQRLHDLVCTGQIDLPTAQHELARDWIGAYKKYFGSESPRWAPHGKMRPKNLHESLWTGTCIPDWSAFTFYIMPLRNRSSV
jgi:hypothetical protein